MGEEAGTRERLLEAAEALFAERGIDAASLRDITQRADANVAAVNYHFDTKEGLVQAVYERRLAPLNDERIRLLDLTVEAAGAQVPTLESILKAFIEPTIRFCAQYPNFMGVIGRLQFESNPEFRAKFIANFREIAQRYEEVLKQALPEIPVEELYWRFHFMIGALIYTWTNHVDVELISEGACTFSGDQDMAKRLVAFAAAGLRAPAAWTKKAERE